MPTAHPWTVPCDSCGAPIFFAVNAATGRRMPIDAEPRDDGLVTVDGDPRSLAARLTLTATVLGPLEAEMHDGPHYASHFATCPEADSWRGHTRASRRKPHREHA